MLNLVLIFLQFEWTVGLENGHHGDHPQKEDSAFERGQCCKDQETEGNDVQDAGKGNEVW